ncbi:MAG: class IV adenylate cyclase [Candidatus Aminicenantes bacterium]|nr:class IV adenylate cyclase [Candidatus Aminicenantes bacterium]
MTEVEIKVRIADAEALAAKLRELGAVPVHPRRREDNVLYDFSSGDLRRRQEALRVRVVGKKCFLTFKGQPQRSRRFKVRTEHESEVRSAAALRKILRSLGLRQTARYGKFRTVFRLGRLTICLDELTIGRFLELEGKRSDIVKVARALGYGPADFIRSSYLTLLAEAAARKA